MSSQVDITLPAWIVQAGKHDARATCAFRWDSNNPAEVTLRLCNLDETDNVELWHAARSAFVVALLPSHLGSWAGAGSFAVRASRTHVRLALKPLTGPRTTWAFIDVQGCGQVERFIAHTLTLCPRQHESAATLKLVDQALAEIFQ